jgi:hypothetical protein
MALIAKNHDEIKKATRIATDEAVFGFPCYEGAFDPETSQWSGVHAGTGTSDEAVAWVKGEDVKLMKVRPK